MLIFDFTSVSSFECFHLLATQLMPRRRARLVQQTLTCLSGGTIWFCVLVWPNPASWARVIYELPPLRSSLPVQTATAAMTTRWVGLLMHYAQVMSTVIRPLTRWNYWLTSDSLDPGHPIRGLASEAVGPSDAFRKHWDHRVFGARIWTHKLTCFQVLFSINI